MRQLLIMEQIAPDPAPGNRFRLIEVYSSVDGPRTRVTHNSFPTAEDARQFIMGIKDGEALTEGYPDAGV